MYKLCYKITQDNKCTPANQTFAESNDIPKDCNPSPCGPNAQCNAGACTCLPEYYGDPYRMCRPECILNTDCTSNKACVYNKCIDPCHGTCGQNAQCMVYNHIPMCNCPPGMSGNAFILCSVQRGV